MGKSVLRAQLVVENKYKSKKETVPCDSRRSQAPGGRGARADRTANQFEREYQAIRQDTKIKYKCR
jgi:hypothetical protein